MNLSDTVDSCSWILVGIQFKHFQHVFVTVRDYKAMTKYWKQMKQMIEKFSMFLDFLKLKESFL